MKNDTRVFLITMLGIPFALSLAWGAHAAYTASIVEVFPEPEEMAVEVLPKPVEKPIEEVPLEKPVSFPVVNVETPQPVTPVPAPTPKPVEVAPAPTQVAQVEKTQTVKKKVRRTRAS